MCPAETGMKTESLSYIWIITEVGLGPGVSVYTWGLNKWDPRRGLFELPFKNSLSLKALKEGETEARVLQRGLWPQGGVREVAFLPMLQAFSTLGR